MDASGLQVLDGLIAGKVRDGKGKFSKKTHPPTSGRGVFKFGMNATQESGDIHLPGKRDSGTSLESPENEDNDDDYDQPM